ncbi:MAG: hypothetical protein K6U04_09130 [Armatimonadetes bacterium]|nr:hypothetical protein [Armatimonadota bacterium]
MIIRELGKKLLLVFLLLFCLGTALPSDEPAVWGELPFLAQTQAGKVCETRRSDQPAKEEIKNPPARIKTTPPGQIAVRTVAGSLLLPRFYQSVYF